MNNLAVLYATVMGPALILLEKVVTENITHCGWHAFSIGISNE